MEEPHGKQKHQLKGTKRENSKKKKSKCIRKSFKQHKANIPVKLQRILDNYLAV